MERHRAAKATQLQGYSPTEMTVTDLGSSIRDISLFLSLTGVGFGITAFCASKLLMLSTAGAVSVSPVAEIAAIACQVRGDCR